jgi:hypothetical protein
VERKYIAEVQTEQRKAQETFWVKTRLKGFDLTLRPGSRVLLVPALSKEQGSRNAFWFSFILVIISILLSERYDIERDQAERYAEKRYQDQE